MFEKLLRKCVLIGDHHKGSFVHGTTIRAGITCKKIPL